MLHGLVSSRLEEARAFVNFTIDTNTHLGKQMNGSFPVTAKSIFIAAELLFVRISE